MNFDLPDLPAAVCLSVGDPELWHPRPGQSSEPAKRICAGCPEIEACLSYGMTHDVEGVWGATTHEERRKARRELKMATINQRPLHLSNTPTAVQRRANRQALANGATGRFILIQQNRAEALRMHAAGSSPADIGKALNIHRRTVQRYLFGDERDVA